FGRRWHGGLPSLPGLRSTGSCPCRSCRSTCPQAGSARSCLCSRWRSRPGPSLPSPGAVRTSPPTCRPPPSSRPDRTPSPPPPATVESGPYRFTRNPIYLGLFLGLIGLAIAFDNLWLLIMLVPFALVIRYGVVAREEAYLERKFGDVYRGYRSRVRRWLWHAPLPVGFILRQRLQL